MELGSKSQAARDLSIIIIISSSMSIDIITVMLILIVIIVVILIIDLDMRVRIPGWRSSLGAPRTEGCRLGLQRARGLS